MLDPTLYYDLFSALPRNLLDKTIILPDKTKHANSFLSSDSGLTAA